MLRSGSTVPTTFAPVSSQPYGRLRGPHVPEFQSSDQLTLINIEPSLWPLSSVGRMRVFPPRLLTQRCGEPQIWWESTATPSHRPSCTMIRFLAHTWTCPPSANCVICITASNFEEGKMLLGGENAPGVPVSPGELHLPIHH